jgi:hypothetical protein
VKIIVFRYVTLCGLVETNVSQQTAAYIFRAELFHFLKIETVYSSETLKNIYETTQHYVLEDINLRLFLLELRSCSNAVLIFVPCQLMYSRDNQSKGLNKDKP